MFFLTSPTTSHDLFRNVLLNFQMYGVGFIWFCFISMIFLLVPTSLHYGQTNLRLSLWLCL